VIREIAPTGRLRAALNFGNKVLVQRAGDGSPKGITPALATELGKRLGLEVDFVPHERAEAVFESGKTGVWDVCFLASDPSRATEIGFTAPYVTIAGVYVVAEASSFTDVQSVDRTGVRIGVSQGSAYDLFLTRAIKQAELVRITGAHAIPSLLLEEKADVAAGIQQPMEEFVAAMPGYRVISEPFMEITQAMGAPAARKLAVKYLARFIEDVKSSGFVRDVLDRNGQSDVAVARSAALT
jgi:polar amino acid transport system substrate-binding protein